MTKVTLKIAELEVLHSDEHRLRALEPAEEFDEMAGLLLCRSALWIESPEGLPGFTL